MSPPVLPKHTGTHRGEVASNPTLSEQGDSSETLVWCLSQPEKVYEVCEQNGPEYFEMVQHTWVYQVKGYVRVFCGQMTAMLEKDMAEKPK